MNKQLHKAAALLLSGALFLSLLAGCAPPASTPASSSTQPQTDAAISSDALVIAE